MLPYAPTLRDLLVEGVDVEGLEIQGPVDREERHVLLRHLVRHVRLLTRVLVLGAGGWKVRGGGKKQTQILKMWGNKMLRFSVSLVGNNNQIREAPDC